MCCRYVNGEWTTCIHFDKADKAVQIWEKPVPAKKQVKKTDLFPTPPPAGTQARTTKQTKAQPKKQARKSDRKR